MSSLTKGPAMLREAPVSGEVRYRVSLKRVEYGPWIEHNSGPAPAFTGADLYSRRVEILYRCGRTERISKARFEEPRYWLHYPDAGWINSEDGRYDIIAYRTVDQS